MLPSEIENGSKYEVYKEALKTASNSGQTDADADDDNNDDASSMRWT